MTDKFTPTMFRLKAIRRLLSDPEHWTKNRNAADAEGRKVRSYDPEAVCWCLMGGISKVLGDDRSKDHYDDFASLIRHNVRMLGWSRGIVPWNDDPERTHEDVLAVIDQAIEFERIRNGVNQ